MVKRFLKLLNKNSDSVNQAAIFLAFFALLAQVLGLLRDRALASLIGPSETLDIYYAAFRIPDLIFVSIASLTSVVVLLPSLAERIKFKEEANRFFNNIFSTFTILLIISSVIAFFLMPNLVKLIVPGFGERAIALTTNLSRLMLLSPIFLGLSTMFGAVTQLFKKFFLFSLLPLLYNFGVLLGVVWFYPIFGLTGLGLGVILGAFLHFIVQVPTVYHLGFRPKITLPINWREVKEVVFLSLPRTLGLALNSLTIVVLLALASKIATGSISIFNFALHLQTVPITLIGVSFSMAAFPTLSLLVEEKEKFLREFNLAARQVIFWSLPILALFIVLRAQIVRVVLGAGVFSWDNTKLTAAVLALFALAITSQSLVLLFTRGFYAAKKTFQAFFINLISALLTIVFAFILLYIFQKDQIRLFLEAILRVRNLSGTHLLALPLAYSLGSAINCLLHWHFFKRDFAIPGLGLYRTFWQSAFAAVTVGLVSYLFLFFFGKVFNINTFLGIFSQGLLAGLFGLAFGVALLLFFDNQELKNIIEILKTKFWKAKVVISEEAIETSSGK